MSERTMIRGRIADAAVWVSLTVLIGVTVCLAGGLVPGSLRQRTRHRQSPRARSALTKLSSMRVATSLAPTRLILLKKASARDSRSTSPGSGTSSMIRSLQCASAQGFLWSV